MTALARIAGIPFLMLVAMTPTPADERNNTVPVSPELREKCLNVLRGALKGTGDNFWPAMHAAEALTLAGHGQEVLTELAKRSETDDQKRCGLAREAVRAGDRTKLPILFELLDKPGSNGHVHAAESLFKVVEIGDGTKMRAALVSKESPKLNMMAAAALTKCGNPTSLETARKFLTDSNPTSRQIAVWVLGFLGNPNDVKSLRAMKEKETDPVVKSRLINTLAMLTDGDARQELGRSLSDPDAGNRALATEFVGHIRAAEFRPTLIKLLDDPNLDVRVRAAQSLLALTTVKPDPTSILVADVYRVTEANPRYSEGSVAILNDGTLLYATTEFAGGARDHSTAQIVGRETKDGGLTWSKPRVLQENVGSQNVMSVSLRRLKPNAVDGPLGMFYLVKNSPTDLKVYLRVSTDEGKTFGPPVMCTDQHGYHVLNNDRVTVLSNGRIICPVAWYPDIGQKNPHAVAMCFFSDDMGKTWKKSAGHADADPTGRGSMEPEVIELKDGTVRMIIRTQLGHVATSLSKDGGNTWSEVTKLPLKAPSSPATTRRIPATGELLIVWNNTTDKKRTPLAAAISSNEGQTWNRVQNLESDPERGYAYTSILFVKDRVLLTYYITDPGHAKWSSRFRSMPVSGLYEK